MDTTFLRRHRVRIAGVVGVVTASGAIGLAVLAPAFANAGARPADALRTETTSDYTPRPTPTFFTGTPTPSASGQSAPEVSRPSATDRPSQRLTERPRHPGKLRPTSQTPKPRRTDVRPVCPKYAAGDLVARRMSCPLPCEVLLRKKPADRTRDLSRCLPSPRPPVWCDDRYPNPDPRDLSIPRRCISPDPRLTPQRSSR
jgi:hypothetical protein